MPREGHRPDPDNSFQGVVLRVLFDHKNGLAVSESFEKTTNS